MMKVGKIRDAHGMRGELYIILFAGSADWLEKAKVLTFTGMKPNKDGKHIPDTVSFPLKSCRVHKKGLIAKMEGLTTRDGAEALIGYLLEIPLELLKSEKGQTIFLSEIVDFEVFDRENRVGKILRFTSNGAQDLLVVKEGEKEWEIPLVPQLIQEIKWPDRQIVMNLPEGLLN